MPTPKFKAPTLPVRKATDQPAVTKGSTNDNLPTGCITALSAAIPARYRIDSIPDPNPISASSPNWSP
jgi:hypothetical protein